jgi:hypothetical protein
MAANGRFAGLASPDSGFFNAPAWRSLQHIFTLWTTSIRPVLDAVCHDLTNALTRQPSRVEPSKTALIVVYTKWR